MARNTLYLLFTLSLSMTAFAEDRIELKITTIKGNKELPKILYIVPWKEVKPSAKKQQELVLHSLYGNLFDPVLPVR